MEVDQIQKTFIYLQRFNTTHSEFS